MRHPEGMSNLRGRSKFWSNSKSWRVTYALEKLLKRKTSVQDINAVIGDSNFTKVIESVRTDLGLTNTMPTDYDEQEAEQWIVNELANKSVDKKDTRYYYDLLEDELITIFEHTGLHPWGWTDFIVAYIALNQKPEKVYPHRIPAISVESVDEEKHELVIRLKAGLTAEDYYKSWQVFKPLLKKSGTKETFAEALDEKIFIDRQTGMTQWAIAKKYYPELMEKTETQDIALTKVKRSIKRLSPEFAQYPKKPQRNKKTLDSGF